MKLSNLQTYYWQIIKNQISFDKEDLVKGDLKIDQ